MKRKQIILKQVVNLNYDICTGNTVSYGTFKAVGPLLIFETVQEVQRWMGCSTERLSPKGAGYVVMSLREACVITGSLSSKYEHRHCCVTLKM